MKLHQATNTIERSGHFQESAMKFAVNGKSFALLSETLYKDPIKAIVRELCSNARDSHVQAGKSAVPFLVKSPSSLDDEFAVEDYGIGMDDDTVRNIYGSYFTSTKEQSDDFVGCFGLGSKTPLAYVQSFNLTATKGGIRNIYTVYVNEVQVPTICLLQSAQVDEPDGVRVGFAVKRQDISRFRTEIQSAFDAYEVPPQIEGDAQIIPPKWLLERPTYGILEGEKKSGIMVGGVMYPLQNNVPLRNIQLKFNIGELELSLSRDDIKDSKKNKEAISTRLRESLTDAECVIKDTIRLELTKLKTKDKLLLAHTQAELYTTYYDKHNVPTEIITQTPAQLFGTNLASSVWKRQYSSRYGISKGTERITLEDLLMEDGVCSNILSAPTHDSDTNIRKAKTFLKKNGLKHVFIVRDSTLDPKHLVDIATIKAPRIPLIKTAYKILTTGIRPKYERITSANLPPLSETLYLTNSYYNKLTKSIYTRRDYQNHLKYIKGFTSQEYKLIVAPDNIVAQNPHLELKVFVSELVKDNEKTLMEIPNFSSYNDLVKELPKDHPIRELHVEMTKVSKDSVKMAHLKALALYVGHQINSKYEDEWNQLTSSYPLLQYQRYYDSKHFAQYVLALDFFNAKGP